MQKTDILDTRKKPLDLGFLKEFDKELSKMVGIGTSSLPPRYWYSTGNYVLNRIISGSYFRGIPQGRVTDLAGASGAGKSFLAANLVKSAQQSGAYILVIDSENALDDDFMTKIGVDVTNGYKYVEVTTIPQVINVVSSFLKGYKKQMGEAEDAPEVFILIDSLDMLMTETELGHYDKGDAKGDQGQRNKQLKAMLRTFVQDIKKLNVTLVCTSQVYKNQDVTNGEGVWIVSDAVKYAASQIVLLSKLKLKDESGKPQSYAGIRMKCEGYKTRFTAPFSVVTIEVPYESGMNPYSGLLDAAKELGVVESKGAWNQIVGEDDKWYAKNIDQHADKILKLCEQHSDTRLSGDFVDVEEDFSEEGLSAQAKRQEKATTT
jgi:recombination protein RecA